MPAGPPPTTTQRCATSARARGPRSSSRPAIGLTVQDIGRPRLPRPKQPWFSRMQCRIPAPAFALVSPAASPRSFRPRSGSAIWARVSATMSAMPERMTSSASSTATAAPTLNTGTSGFAALTAAASSRSHA